MAQVPPAGAVVQRLAPPHPPVGPADGPGPPDRAIDSPEEQQEAEEHQGGALHPGPSQLRPQAGQSAPRPAVHGGGQEKLEAQKQADGYPGPHVAPPQALEGGGLLGGVQIELRGVAALRGTEHVDHAIEVHVLPAAVLVHPDLLLRQARLLQEPGGGHLDPVPGPAGRYGGEFAQILPPLHQTPAFGFHVAVELLCLPDGVLRGMEPVSIFLHLSPPPKRRRPPPGASAAGTPPAGFPARRR